MNKWQLARYFIDAKKDIDSIMFISKNVLKLRNLDLRRIINYKLTEFYINLCVVYDKSLNRGKVHLKKEDEIIKSTYYERDKNYAHKDDDYEKVEFKYDNIITILKRRLEHCSNICKDFLPIDITIDYVIYDRDLYRFIGNIDYNKEEQIKSLLYPEYNNKSGVPLKTVKAFYDTEDIKDVNSSEDYGVIFEAGICFEETIQNLQDSCIKSNVLYNQNMWCTLNKKS